MAKNAKDSAKLHHRGNISSYKFETTAALAAAEEKIMNKV